MDISKTSIEFIVEKTKEVIRKKNEEVAKTRYGEENIRPVIAYVDSVLARISETDVERRMNGAISERSKRTINIIQNQVQKHKKYQYSFHCYEGLKDGWIVINAKDIPGPATWKDMRLATNKSEVNEGRWKAVTSSRYINNDDEKTKTSRCLRINTNTIVNNSSE